MSFRNFNEGVNPEVIINEGGNLELKGVQAQKIDMSKSTRKEFVSLSNKLFVEINKLYQKEYKNWLWVDEKKLFSGELFNGSTSFIFSPEYSDDDIMKYKTKSGDIDIIIPKEKAANLWNLLAKWEDKEIIPGVEYLGNNRNVESKLGDQINSIFKVTFSNGYYVPMQVDFEMLTVDEYGTPDEFSKFSHSSTYEDLTIGQKGVAQKYIMIALGGGISLHKDVLIVTEKSTKDNYHVKLKGGEPISQLTTVKFSVDKGLRKGAFEKQDYKIDGKIVFREVKAPNSTYEQSLAAIFEVFFGKPPSKSDMKKFWSYKGINELMKKYLKKDQIKATYNRMIARTWEKGAQGLETENGSGTGKELDYQIKDSMNGYMERFQGIKRSGKIEKMITAYYKNYRVT